MNSTVDCIAISRVFQSSWFCWNFLTVDLEVLELIDVNKKKKSIFALWKYSRFLEK